MVKVLKFLLAMSLMISCQFIFAGEDSFEALWNSAQGDFAGEHKDEIIKQMLSLDDNSVEVNCLLTLLLEGNGVSDCKRREDYIKPLLNKGAIPIESEKNEKRDGGLFSRGCECTRSSDLSHAIRGGCKNIIDLVIQKMDAVEIGKAIEKQDVLFKIPESSLEMSAKNNEKHKKVEDQIKELQRKCSTGEASWACERKKMFEAKENASENASIAAITEEKQNKEKFNRDIVKSILDSLQKKCSLDGKGSEACKQANSVESKETAYIASAKQQEVIDAVEKQKRKKKQEQEDAERAAKEAEAAIIKLQNDGCGAYNGIKLADKLVQHEKEIGKEVGYVNKDAIYQAGQIKVINKHNLEKIKKEYLNKTGKEMSLSSCKEEALGI